MAKKIVAIKCPQCGSSECKLIYKDHYQCLSCNTLYTVEDDAININVNHQKSGFNLSKKAIILIAVIGALLALSFSIIVLLVFTSRSSPPSVHPYSVASPRPMIYKSDLVLAKDGQPLFVGIEEENLFSAEKKIYYVIKDLTTKEILSKEDLKDIDSYDYVLRTFNDGSVYFVTEDNLIYQIDRDNKKIVDINQTMFSNHKELASGIASLKFTYKSYGDGFHITTNMGDEYYYYPLIDKLYTKEEFKKTIDFGANYKLITNYLFTGSFKKEPVKLLSVTYKYNGGKGSYDTDPTLEQLVSDKAVVSYKDLTPDRVYFDALVLFFDAREVIISFRPTAAENAPIVVQSLQLPSMNINWSLNFDPKIETRADFYVDSRMRYAIKNDDNYYLCGTMAYYKISKDGKLIETHLYNKY